MMTEKQKKGGGGGIEVFWENASFFRTFRNCILFVSETCCDPYVMEEEDPAQCHALESSLWEIKARFI